MFSNQSALYKDPHLTYPIDDIQLPFLDYINQSKQIIETHRLDLQQFREPIIQANTPFEFRPEKPARFGALLIHGLFDSPFLMSDIGKNLCKEGLLVRSILLPGHGTVPGALLNIQYGDWLKAAYYGISTFKNEVEKIFLVGFSAGGAISCYQALQSLPIPIAGLILLAPVFKIRFVLTPLSGPINHLGEIFPRLKWVSKKIENDYARYQSIAMNAVHQIELLIKKLTQAVIHYPQLVIASLNDKTVDSTATLNYFSRNTHPNSQMILYTPKHTNLNDPRITTRNSHYPEQNILDISHIGIPVSPLNPHYGKQGNCPFASRDNLDPTIVHDEVNPSEELYYDCLYKLGLSHQRHRRLTYNPDFDFMMEKICEFIQEGSSLNSGQVD